MLLGMGEGNELLRWMVWGAIGTAAGVEGSGEDLVAMVRGRLGLKGRTTGVAWRVQGSMVTTI